MGKPIAGQNQFPYSVGGFLVDGANINGVTYAKKLYIYKQRSYDMYDLQDTSGNIYRNIRIGYQTTTGEMLNYFDVDEDLVLTIPVNTFFLKIQDPSRNIFSFVRIYQWHKCITVEGDYVFRTSDIDPRLSGVLINPVTSTIPLGNTLSYNTLFYPSSYKDVDGTWYMNSLDGIRDTDHAAKIVSTDKNKAIVEGMKLGKSVLSFVPSSNSALVTHSIISVIQEVQPVELFSVQNVVTYDQVKNEDEYVLEVVTYPYDAVLTEALEVQINTYMEDSSSTELVSVSDDFKKYTFKTTLADPEPGTGGDYRYSNPIFNFIMKTPIEYTYNYGNVMVYSDEAYNSSFQSPGIMWYGKPWLRPNMTYQTLKYQNGPGDKMYPYVSSDDEIATFDYETGIVTTYQKLGKVTFSTQYDKLDGSGTETIEQALSFTIREDVYDTMICDPQQVDVVNPGEQLEVKITGYREGYEPQNIPLRKTNDSAAYTIDEETGVVSVLDTAPSGRIVYVWPKDIAPDYQVLALYNSVGIKPIVRKPDELVPMTELYSNDNIYFIRYSDVPNMDMKTNIIVYARPNNCSNYAMKFDSYDETIVEVVDKEFLVDSFIYAMGGSLYFYVTGLKRGSTEMVISSVDYPDLKIKLKLVVF